MSIASEITRLQNAKTSLKTAINAKGGTITDETIDEYAGFVDTLEVGGAELPSTGSQNMFTGATIPLTYKNNTHDYENNYEYKSATHNITITGLDGRATITGNGTKNVEVSFNVTSATSSLKNFTITCVNGDQTLTYNGLHAHYGSTATGILTLAYTNITPDGSEGTIDTNYKFVETDSATLPLFTDVSTLWNTIYSYQVLNVLMGNYSSSSTGNHFLRYCYSFNQPLTLPSSLSSVGTYLLGNCHSFNQPLTLPSSLSSIGDYSLSYCYSFNQPLTLPSSLTSIGDRFLSNGYSFNQPLALPSNLTSIGSDFLRYCSSFNKPLALPSSLSSIGTYLLGNCYSFNQPLTLPSSLSSIGDYSLHYCYSFNQPLTLPSSITSIGAYFLLYCYSFNQPLTLPSSLTSIGSDFLHFCYSFNQPLTLPSNLTSIGSNFLGNCYSLSTIIYNASVYPTDSSSLSEDRNTKASSMGTGIKVYGTKRAELMSALPNRTSPFRKLINGGS